MKIIGLIEPCTGALNGMDKGLIFYQKI